MRNAKYIRLALTIIGILTFFVLPDMKVYASSDSNQTSSGLTFISSSPKFSSKNFLSLLNSLSSSELLVTNSHKKSVLDSILVPTPGAKTAVNQDERPQPISASVISASITESEVVPSPSPTVIPKEAQTTTQNTDTTASNPGGLNADILFGMVNSYRQSKNLTSFQKDDRSCILAQARAPEIAGEIASGHMHAGMYGRNLPYWNTENIITMNSEAAAFNWWINDTIHREQIEGSFSYSCVACSGNACAEEFTNFQPK